MKKIIVLSLLGLFLVAAVALCADDSTVVRSRDVIKAAPGQGSQRATESKATNQTEFKYFAVKVRDFQPIKVTAPPKETVKVVYFAAKIPKGEETSFLATKKEERYKVIYFAAPTGACSK